MREIIAICVIGAILLCGCLNIEEKEEKEPPMFIVVERQTNWDVVYHSDLVIYDKPRELSEFVRPCNHVNDCWTCDRYDYIGNRCYDKITRPPQSWCYVESEGEHGRGSNIQPSS